MALDQAEAQSIIADLESGKSFNEIALLKPLGENMVLRTAKQEETFKTNFEQQIEESKIAPRISEIYGQLDKDVLESSGVEKTTNEKTYDYLKRVMGDFKSKSDSSDQAMADLKSQIDTEGADLLRGELEEWKTKYKTDLGTKDSEIETMQISHLKLSKQRHIDESFRGVSKEFVADLPGFFDSHKNSVFNNLIANSKLSSDGSTLIPLKDGTPIKDANFAEIGLDAYLKEQFKEVIKTGAGQGGAGGGSGSGGDGGGDGGSGGGQQAAWETITRPEDIKTQVALRTWLKEGPGKDLDRADFSKAFEKLREGIPIQ